MKGSVFSIWGTINKFWNWTWDGPLGPILQDDDNDCISLFIRLKKGEGLCHIACNLSKCTNLTEAQSRLRPNPGSKENILNLTVSVKLFV